MAGDDTEFNFVAASVRRAARLEREYAEAFLQTAIPGTRAIGEQFVELCLRIDEVLNAYQVRYASTSDDVDRTLVLNATRDLLAQTRSLQLRRSWLDAAAAPPIDLGSFYFLSGLARAIVREDSELTVVATHEGSYATLVNPFRGPDSAGPPAIVLVALVPHRETRSGLLHPLLVHEIGHGVAKVHGFTERLQSELASEEVERILTRGAAQQAERTGRTVAEERAALDTRLGAWIEEIFCDAIATTCLGATYIFSFVTEVLPGDLDQAGVKHPPTRQRVRLILDHLDRLGWRSILDRAVAPFMRWLRDVAGADTAEQAPDDEALRGAVDVIGTAIQAAVDEHVGSRAALPDDEALAAVLDLLAQHIPPAQRDSGPAIDRPVIILGCWLSAMQARGATVDCLAEAVDSPELAELLPYALELSVIVNRWQRVV